MSEPSPLARSPAAALPSSPPSVRNPEMSIFSRTRDIIAANVIDLVNRSDDPAKMIRVIIMEMEETLVEVRASAARGIADQKEKRRQVAAARRLAGQLDRARRARNVALRSSLPESDYVAFLDSDDIWPADFLQRTGDALGDFSRCGRGDGRLPAVRHAGRNERRCGTIRESLSSHISGSCVTVAASHRARSFAAGRLPLRATFRPSCGRGTTRHCSPRSHPSGGGCTSPICVSPSAATSPPCTKGRPTTPSS